MTHLTEFETFGQDYHGDEIAIVGMALRVPGANTVDGFWELLQSGLNPFEPLSEESLRAAGVDPGLFQQHNYVRRSLSMNKVKAFDPGFFGFSALDAALMDPQYRHFLELCWEVFEHAGEKIDELQGTVGIYAGSGQNGYLIHHLAANPKLVEDPGHWYLRHVGNDKDFMTTRASYHLNLHGPSINVQTACSTSLVASHLACQSLISRECDMAIAGGVTIAFPHAAGYLAQDGGIEDPRGECRSFDASSKGTVFSSGGAVILLKRLEDALKDKNTVYGVVRASAVNNDGATKASFTAPSVDGQISVILETLDLGEVHPESIGYVEAHGTGTPIGDPIEVEAMSSAWRTHTKKTQFAALSSAKSNVGHMDTASGVVSIIKSLGCLYQGYKYPTAHYKSPNPGLSIETSPFYVSNQLEIWDSPSQLRRSCVSALGVGGTNCHMILEEAPRRLPVALASHQTQKDKTNIILPISAKTPSALQRNIQNMTEFLQKQLILEPSKRIALADIAHTLVNGRCHFAHRAVIQACDIADALATLQGENPGSLAIGNACETPPKKIVFAFTGQGTQYFNMGLCLYNSNTAYRETLDQCAEILIPLFGHDIRTIVFNDNPTQEERDFLDRIDVTHPILFSMAYGMAKAWIAEGYTPDALIGHSLGEYVGATIAGVFELKEVLALVCKRGELMHSTPRGVMLSVAADESEVLPYLEAEDLKDTLSIAGVNVLGMTVVAGQPEAGSVLIERLEAQDISCKALRIPIASHCFMMDPILDAYEQAVAQCTLKKPTLPIVSNIDGRWLEPAAATKPSYWRQHLRSAVRFADGTSTLMKNTEGYLFIEIGPGSQLTRLIERHPHKGNNHQAISTMPGPADEEDSGRWFDLAPARIWSMGGHYNWSTQNALSQGQKYALPTYPWDHQDYWFDLPRKNAAQNKGASKALFRQNIEDWFYLPGWQQGFRPTVVHQTQQQTTGPEEVILIVTDHLSTQLHMFRQECIEREYHVVIALRSDTNAIVTPGNEYLISGLESTSYTWLLEQLTLEFDELNNQMSYIVNWVEASEMPDLLYQNKSRVQHYFEQNLYLVQALGSIDWAKLTLGLIGKGILEVFAGELDDPSKVLAFGPFRTLAAEQINVQFVSIDIRELHHISQVLPELEAYSVFSEQHSIPVDEIAFRGSDRFFRTYHATPIQEAPSQATLPQEAHSEKTGQSINVRHNGVYLFVGLGDLAITAAQALVSQYNITPVFVSRSQLPDQIHWEKLAQSAKVDSNTRRIRQLLDIYQQASSITCLQADASQSDQMTHVFEQVLATHGTINGVFHSAGVLDDQLLALKTMQSAEKVLAPKVFGLDAYDALFESNILDFLVLYSSVSSLIGVVGQVDYSAANAYLAAYARYQNQGLQRPVIALHWGIWRDIGMATEEAKRQGLQDSVDDFIVEPFNQVSWLVSKSFGTIQLCQGTLSSSSSWVLQDHQTKQGLGVYPGSGYIDAFANVYQNLEPFQSFEIRDLIFQTPFILTNNGQRFVGVAASIPDAQQNRTCQFLSWHSGPTLDSTPDHDQVIIHASCEIRPLKDHAQAPSLTHLRDRFNQTEYHDETQHAHMNFGARWQTLRASAQLEHEALLELALPQEFISDLQEHPWHPGLLDIAIGGQFLIPGYESEKTFYVPLSYNSIKSYGNLTPQLYSHCRYRPDESSVEVPVFDFTLYTPEGNVVFEINGFHLKKVEQLTLDGTTLPTLSPITQAAASNHKVICPLVLLEQSEETLFEKLLTFGINPEDGAEALLRVLNLNPLPSQILISSMPFDRYCNAVGTTKSNSQDTSNRNELMSRPAISTPFEPLHSLMEQGIGEIWEHALGIKDLGRYDGFFELGGHSLLLIQIIARLKKKFPVKINMADLFEVTTIAQWAELIEASTPKNSPEADPGQHNAQNKDHVGTLEIGNLENSTQTSDLPPVTAVPVNAVSPALNTPVTAKNPQIEYFSNFKERIIGTAGLPSKPTQNSDEFEVYPATYSQKALHFLQTFQPESVPYSIPFEYWFSNAINPIVLQKALNIMVNRHDILRTVYRQFDGELKQVVYHTLPITLEVINATDWTKAEIKNQIFNLTQTPFDLNNGPLLQSTLFKKSETCWAWYLGFHHISFDHLAIWQFARELDQIYSRLLISPDSVTQFQPNLQMRDYASWQAQHQTPDYLRNKMGYWIKNIPDPSVYLDLPTDFSRPVMSRAKGQELIFSFPKSTTYALTETAKQCQVSRYLLSMTIYASLLHRYSGAQKIIIGTPFANRGDQEELQKTIGCFMNTLPMVFDFNDNPTLHTLLRRTQAGFLEVFKSQDVAFELIIETLQPPRNTSHHPLFQVAFMYQDPPMEISLGGLQAENKFLHNGSAKFDMLMWLWDRDSHIEGSIEYSQELFTESSMLRFLDVYFHLIGAMTENPNQPLQDIQLIHPSRVSEAALFGPKTDVIADNLPSLFENALKNRAKTDKNAFTRTAAMSDNISLTYQQLESKMIQVSAFLKSEGVHNGDLVGICMHRSANILPILLGILQCGGAYVPLDPDYPNDRLKYMISHSGMGCIITEDTLQQKVKDLLRSMDTPEEQQIPRLLLAQECLDSPIELSQNSVQQIISPSQTAYVIYTSGSTGLPKGVNVPHSALVNFLTSMATTPGFRSGDRLMALTTLSFDISILEIFLPITCGGTVDIVPLDVSRDGFALLKRLLAFNPTVMQATPATWRLLLAAGFNGATSEQRTLKALIGGEALPHDLVTELLPSVKELWNMYGPTETTIWSTCQQITDASIPIEIGTPIANTQCYVLDEHQSLLPPGVPGELYIGGQGLSLGYLHQDDLTQERFISCPEFAEGLIYKTGDRVTRLPHGVLRYHNRLDLQIKIRGYRIELGEIEHQLLMLTDLMSGAVIAQDQHIVAFYVVQKNTTLLEQDVRQHLSSTLPKYMLPDFYIPLESLPLTPAGKIDRKALANFAVQPTSAAVYEPPSTDMEKTIAELWEQALDIQDLGRHDSFFELGGHSLLLIQIIARLKIKVTVNVHIAEFFGVRTIAEWSALIEASLSSKSQGADHLQEQGNINTEERNVQKVDLPPVTAITAPPRVTKEQGTELDLELKLGLSNTEEYSVYPTTYPQRAIHFLQTFHPDSVSYTIPMEFWFDTALNPILLQQAINVLVRRHDILRTVYRVMDSQLKQVVYHTMPFTLHVIDATQWTQGQIKAKISTLTQTPFDLENGPILHSTLFKKSETRWAWYLCVHHISFDLLATAQLTRELDEIYSQLLISPEACIESQPQLQMRDYATWQLLHQTPDYLRGKMDYWIDNIPDPSIHLDLPTDFPRPAMSEAKGKELFFKLPNTAARALTESAKQLHVSRYILGMTIYAYLLHRYSGAEKVIIGTPFANRGDQEELQNTMGCLINTLPLVFDFHDNPSLNTLVKRTQKGFLDVFRSQDVAYELIIESLQPPRNTSHHPLFQVVFMYQAPGVKISLGGLPTENCALHNGSAKFDMTMTLWDKASDIEGYIEYSTELFTETSIQGFLDVYSHLIEAVTEQPDLCLKDIQLVHPSHIAEAALFGPISHIEYDNLPALFEGALANRMASNTAALLQTAVVSDQQSLTYQQLREKMKHVSAFLQNKGVKNGDLIGIYMHRSANIMPILLGILNAGAAYVPLDPDYPSDRLKYMISHSGMGCIITEDNLHQKVIDLLLALKTPQEQNAPRLLLAKNCLDSSVEILKQSKPQAIRADQTAYVIYTSGSTGLPKGVNVPHSAMVNFLTSMQSTPGFSADDRLMALTTLSFDISILEIFLPIISGGTVDIVPMEISKDGFALLKRMSIFNPTIMQATPATWRLLFVAGFDGNLGDNKKLKVLIGGEALPQDLAQDLLPCVQELWNMYGPTETTIWSTCQHITDTSVPIDIGTPIANTQCYILDEHQRLLPPGVPGELYIGGQGVSHGYLHQDSLTQERFIECPDFAEGLIYKTGDRVTRLPQGVLRYHNRLDLQVKIRGYRIELGEIEHQLLAIPELASGAVITHEQRILAFYVLKINTKLSKLKIRKHLATILPKHMLPDFYVELEALPLTPAGKIDRKKLARTDIQSSESPQGQKPSTPSEFYYASIWGELLKKEINTVSINDNFFDIGGHSLLSLQVVAQSRKDHGIQIPASALVLNTLGQLAVNFPLPEQQSERPLEETTVEQHYLQTQTPTLKSKLSHWWQSMKNRST